MRNVPGEGDCMFLSVALAAGIRKVAAAEIVPPHKNQDKRHQRFARELRSMVAHVLQTSQSLLIEGKRHVPAYKLLQSAAKQENVTPETYLKRLELIGREGGLYGGGPELVVLSNLLRRPISIYELGDDPMKDEAAAAAAAASVKDEEGSVTIPGSTYPLLTQTNCFIKKMGTFGDTFEATSPTDTTTKQLPSHLHILILDTSPTEKHACVLFPIST